MKKEFVLCLGILFICLIVSCGCSNDECESSSFLVLETEENAVSLKSDDRTETELVKELSDDEVEKEIIKVLLDDLFTSRDAYDACHYLMIPMKWAFDNSKQEVICAFSDQFNRFVSYGEQSEDFSKLGGLKKNHWYYLMAEYCCYCEEYGVSYDKALPEHIINYIVNYHDNYHGNWSSFRNYSNLYTLLDGILYGTGYESNNSLNNAITDNELFPLAILCDMNYIIKRNSAIKISEDYKAVISWSQYYVDAMMTQCVKWNDEGGWLFQPGVWDDHNDFAYSGYNCIAEITPDVKKPISNAAWDTSHFQRFPLFLASYERNANDRNIYEKLKEGLSKQLNKYVIVEKLDYFVLNNFMDGRNGVFAYNSNTGKGVDSYEASGSIITAWWSQLDDDYINKLYEGYYNFIMNTDILPNEFEDSLTTRERNTKMINIKWYRTILYCATNMRNTSQ